MRKLITVALVLLAAVGAKAATTAASVCSSGCCPLCK